MFFLMFLIGSGNVVLRYVKKTECGKRLAEWATTNKCYRSYRRCLYGVQTSVSDRSSRRTLEKAMFEGIAIEVEVKKRDPVTRRASLYEEGGKKGASHRRGESTFGSGVQMKSNPLSSSTNELVRVEGELAVNPMLAAAGLDASGSPINNRPKPKILGPGSADDSPEATTSL
jgi:hypothetical protein